MTSERWNQNTFAPRKRNTPVEGSCDFDGETGTGFDSSLSILVKKQKKLNCQTNAVNIYAMKVDENVAAG